MRERPSRTAHRAHRPPRGEWTNSLLQESSILHPLSGDACDVVLERSGSGALLEHLASSRSLYVSPLDDGRHSYRYHPLFRHVLTEGLRRSDAGRFREVHRRASLWHAEQGSIDTAVMHANAAADRDLTGRIILSNLRSRGSRGGDREAASWLERVDERWIEQDPNLVFAAALLSMEAVDLDEVERRLDQARAMPGAGCLADGTPSLAVGTALLTAMVGRFHLKDTQVHTDVVLAAGRTANPWWPLAAGLYGSSLVQTGDVEAGRTLLVDVVDDLRPLPHWNALALSMLALAELERGDMMQAGSRWEQARSIMDVESPPARFALLGHAVGALVEASSGALDRAKVHADTSRSLMVSLGDMRGFAVRLQVLVPALLAEVHILLGDLDAAQELCVRAESARIREPGSVVAERRLAWVRAESSRVIAELPNGMVLTDAERRVLRLLATHQTMQELADQLFVSRNTVKTHALSLYRKLGVSTRSDAVRLARDIHLLRRHDGRPDGSTGGAV